MKVLLSWLQEFAPIPAELAADPGQLADHLSDLGMAVEEMTVLPDLDGVLVGRVADLRPHPNADRIQLVDVELAAGQPTRQVCCGAFNMSVGDLVPVATVGTTMPDGMQIAERKMRGELSQGMCCSVAELGLGTDHDGIMILPEDLVVGESLMDQLGLSGDVLFDLEINPNRPDAMSVAGVARDLAARLRVPFAIPTPQVVESDEDINDVAQVEIFDADLCGRFAVRVIRDVQIAPSPLWLQIRLALCGMRPINSVVDASNFVMLELGTPSHTYDLTKLPDGRIGTRRSPGGEQLTTLDDQQRTLAPGDGVIVDGADQPIGIAGVMGGASTEISDQTSAVLLEMAWWNGASIATTSQRLGLRSEASIRFERGTDWALKGLAVDRFCELLAQITPGALRICRGVIDEAGDLPAQPQVTVRPQRVSHLLGSKFDGGEITELLEPIGFEVSSAAGTGSKAAQPEAGESEAALAVTVPSFRPDTTTETDIAEEVARHYGYGRLGRTVPRSPRPGRLSAHQQLRRRLRQVLVGEGVSEAMPNPFLAPDAVSRAGLEGVDPVRLLNPLVTEESVLRPSLLPGLLTAVGYNESHRNEAVSLFELGTVFLADESTADRDAQDGAGEREHDPHDPSVAFLPAESERLAVILADRDAHAAAQLWAVIADSLELRYSLANTTGVSYMHPTRAAEITLAASGGDGGAIGMVGELDPSVCQRHGISQRCAWLDVNVDVLLGTAAQAPITPYRSVAPYPSADFDLALIVEDSVSAGEVEATLRQAAGEQLQSLRLFDVYRGEQLSPGQRSLAYRLRVQDSDQTLTDAQVAEIRAQCIAAAESAHGAKLR